jgi:hypothetical protein
MEQSGQGAFKWTRYLAAFAASTVRPQLHVLAYNLGKVMRATAAREPICDWPLTSRKEKLIKIGAKFVSHACYVAF